jgi:hypothetical protein
MVVVVVVGVPERVARHCMALLTVGVFTPAVSLSLFPCLGWRRARSTRIAARPSEGRVASAVVRAPRARKGRQARWLSVNFEHRLDTALECAHPGARSWTSTARPARLAAAATARLPPQASGSRLALCRAAMMRGRHSHRLLTSRRLGRARCWPRPPARPFPCRPSASRAAGEEAGSAPSTARPSPAWSRRPHRPPRRRPCP